MHETPQAVNLDEPKSTSRRNRKPARQIMAEVAAEYQIKVSDIIDPCRNRWHVKARCKAMRLVAAEWEWLSYPAIGKLFHRDHSTVMYHLNKGGGIRKKKHCACDRKHGNTHAPTKGGAE